MNIGHFVKNDRHPPIPPRTLGWIGGSGEELQKKKIENAVNGSAQNIQVNIVGGCSQMDPKSDTRACAVAAFPTKSSGKLYLEGCNL